MNDRSAHGSVSFVESFVDDGEWSFDVYPADKCIGENCFPSETPSMSEGFSFNVFVVAEL